MRWTWMGCVVLLACGPKTGADDASESGSESESDAGSAEASSSATTTTATTSASSSSDTGTNVCESLPWHGCQPVGDCGVEACGVAGAGYDENGCLRGSCGSDEDCYDGEVCFHPIDWGGCASSSTFCETDPATGQCFCGGTDDCNGSYCALASSVPSPECLEQTEEAPCLELGCNAFVIAQSVALGPMGCECLGEIGTCLYLPGGDFGDPALTAYYRTDGSEEVRVFPTAYDQDPVGWIRCFDNPGEPESCACIDCP